MWTISNILMHIITFFLSFVLARIVICVLKKRRKRSVAYVVSSACKRREPATVMIVAGSGGHTTEILKLVSVLSYDKYYPRHYVVADTDILSPEKIKQVEGEKEANTRYHISRIRRSREVHQSWLSTLLTSLIASIFSVMLVFKSRPDLILCNGPGTCVPLCFAAFLSTVVGWKRVKIVFVESFCRAKTLSLSGHILYYISDEFLVQWPQLVNKYPLARYIGRLV